jgi:hypothetical protein
MDRVSRTNFPVSWKRRLGMWITDESIYGLQVSIELSRSRTEQISTVLPSAPLPTPFLALEV